MKRFHLRLTYDGTDFCGWASQVDQRSVQQELELACRQVFSEVGEVTAAGRTDAGVHALGQSVHVDLPDQITSQEVINRLNAVLPSDISVLKASEKSLDFHARYGCLGKLYSYRIHNDKIKPTLTRFGVHWEPRKLDIKKIKQATVSLTGYHDFKAFMNVGRLVKDSSRWLYEIEVIEKAPEVHINFLGNGFLYNQIRVMVGTLIEVGLEKKSWQDISGMLMSLDRSQAGPTAPAKGLCLVNTVYSGDRLEEKISAYHADNKKYESFR